MLTKGITKTGRRKKTQDRERDIERGKMRKIFWRKKEPKNEPFGWRQNWNLSL